jgi:hypothetical protein
LFAAALLVVRGLLIGGRDLVRARPYADARNAVFLGLDMQAVPELIDRHLAPQTPVQLGTSFFVDPEFGAAFWFRATSVLYPRRLEAYASHRLELVRENARDGVRLGALSDGRVLVLTGPPDLLPGPAGKTTIALDPVGLAAGLVGLCGLGALVLRVLRLGPARVSTAALGGVLLLAVAAHLSTWMQRPMPLGILMALGVAAALAALLGIGWPSLLEAPPRSALSPWSIVPLVVVTLAMARALLVPVTEWDGRFVWLVHGEQLFFRGFLDLEEAATVGRLQPTYPLLTPALFAFGSCFREAFNERTAVVLLVAFHATVVAATARIAMLRVGPLRGALLAGLSAAMTMGWSTEAYADGLLSSLLILQFLALEGSSQGRLGWLVMACAALTKREGLILSVIVALAQKGRPAFKPVAIALAPALSHVLWCRSVGLAHELDAPRITSDLVDLGSRALFILRRSAGVVSRNLNYALSAVTLLALVALGRRGVLVPTARSALVVALSFSAFILVTFLVTPQPLPWHLDTALSRLALHPVLFALLSAFMLRAPPVRGAKGGDQ